MPVSRWLLQVSQCKGEELEGEYAKMLSPLPLPKRLHLSLEESERIHWPPRQLLRSAPRFYGLAIIASEWRTYGVTRKSPSPTSAQDWSISLQEGKNS